MIKERRFNLSKFNNNIKLIALIVFSLALTQPQVLGKFGIVIWAFMGFISYTEAEYTIFYLALSQVLPDFSGVAGNLAQWAVMIWILYRVFSKRRLEIGIVKPIITYVFPLVLWLTISAFVHEVPSYIYEILKGIIFSFIVYDAFQHRVLDWSRIFFCFILSCLFVTFPFWTGDRVQLNSEIGFIGGNRGYLRIGGWRGNANFVMVILCFPLVGIVYYWLQRKFTKLKQNWGVDLFLFASFLLCFAPLISTQSRTFYIVIPLALIIIIFLEWKYVPKIKLFLTVFYNIIVFTFVLILVMNYILPSWLTRIQSVLYYQSLGGSLLEGRTNVWLAGLQSILIEPIFGTGFVFFEMLSKGAVTSHNTIIDGGIGGGIPGLLLTALYLFSPIFLFRKNIDNKNYRLYLVMYITGILVSMSIALQGLKIMYILWGILFSLNLDRNMAVASK